MARQSLSFGARAWAERRSGADQPGWSGEGDPNLDYDTTPFYDAVADRYHLFYRDWETTLDREGMTLRRMLPQGQYRTVLDASCGTGTQSIALAQQGYQVTAADISRQMLQKAQENAVRFKVADRITFTPTGFLALADTLSGPFDAVLTKGNALPHLLTDGELKAALGNFYRLLRPGGLLIIGMRDFDMILEDRIRFVPGQFHDGPDEQFILFDIWDYDDGPPTIITFNKFMVNGSGETYTVTKNPVRYRALRRTELDQMIAETGFVDCAVENQNWELVFTARRP